MTSRSIIIALVAALAASPACAAPDWARVDNALGRSGAEQLDGVRRYSFPRSDLTVTLDGVQIRPALALGSWLAFQPAGNEAMLMGDLVLLESEVNPVMSRLLESGLTVTALHNHLLRSSPATIYMHVHGHGDPARLAAAVRSALSLSATPLAPPSTSPAPQPAGPP
ncbi:MAG TPA: DUF1259 domain-containing protein, partial [Herpetosiphonaceae bacterium]|nr:DUF1259 domain-containing protein [Herpetosiphonaceae bacterium]